jgi:hypothetical protein
MNSRYSVSLRIRGGRVLPLSLVIKCEYPQVGQVANVIHFVSLLKLTIYRVLIDGVLHQSCKTASVSRSAFITRHCLARGLPIAAITRKRTSLNACANICTRPRRKRRSTRAGSILRRTTMPLLRTLSSRHWLVHGPSRSWRNSCRSSSALHFSG